MPRMRRIFAYWLPLAVVATGLFLLIYIVVQQNYRMNANDPQVQIAEDAAVLLAKDQDPKTVIPETQVNISTSLAPFVMIFDESGTPIASSGLLFDTLPEFPLGALTAAQKSGENRVTWEPQAGLRFAAVVDGYHGGNVVAARSLREVENRIQQTTFFVGVTWLAALVISLILIIFGDFLAFPRSQPNPQRPG